MTSPEHESEQARQLREGVQIVQIEPLPVHAADAQLAAVRQQVLAAAVRAYAIPSRLLHGHGPAEVTIRDPLAARDHVKGLRHGR